MIGIKWEQVNDGFVDSGNFYSEVPPFTKVFTAHIETSTTLNLDSLPQDIFGHIINQNITPVAIQIIGPTTISSDKFNLEVESFTLIGGFPDITVSNCYVTIMGN